MSRALAIALWIARTLSIPPDELAPLLEGSGFGVLLGLAHNEAALAQRRRGEPLN